MPEQEANVRPVTPEQAASLPPDARACECPVSNYLCVYSASTC